MNTPSDLVSPLTKDVVALIYSAKQRAAVSVNSEISLLYWHIGYRIRQEVLGGERADYGKQVIVGLARSLTRKFGRGWSKAQLSYCVKFAEVFPDIEIVHALREQLSWTHIKTLIYVDEPTSTAQATMQAESVEEQVLVFCQTPKTRIEIQEHLGFKNRDYFRKTILNPLIEAGKLRLTLPDKPTSPKQKFYTAD